MFVNTYYYYRTSIIISIFIYIIYNSNSCMGNNKSKISQSYNPTLAGWERISTIEDISIWKNATTQE
jgi:hypothetical protein